MPFEALDEGTILRRLSSEVRRWIRELKVHDEIDSTNSHLIRRASSEPIDGVVCLAESQTSGRGRRGRPWLTVAGRSIAVSLGQTLAMPASEAGPLSLVVGVGVAMALKSMGIRGVGLKWPNDILVDGTKAGGILIELPGVGRPLTAVVGIGLNVGAGREVSQRLGMPIGDLAEAEFISRNELASSVIESVRSEIVEFERAGFASLRGRWEELHAYQHRPVLLLCANDTIEGVARGVSMAGELIVQTADGLRRFTSGEVSLRSSSI